jgi:curved DNA-binding protein CbpA
MKKIEDLNFYELLEVSPAASAQDIHKAYERVRRIYDPNSIALYSLFTADETAAIHRRIEEAYRTLIYEDNRRKYDAKLRERNEMPEMPDIPASSPSKTCEPPEARTLPPLPEAKHFIAEAEPQYAPPPPEKPQSEEITTVSQFIGEFTGPAIKALREQLGISQRTIANRTKVGLRYLDYIEAEEFRKLPARPYLRGFIMLYAKALGCDAERMAGDYMKRYDAAMAAAAKT